MANLKEITGFTGYFVSDEGKIYTNKISYRNNKTGQLKELKLSLKKTGYYYANLYAGAGYDNRKSLRVNRIVYQEFKGCIPDGYYVDHIDNQKGNNKVSNLQLLTPSENTTKYHKSKTK